MPEQQPEWMKREVIKDSPSRVRKVRVANPEPTVRVRTGPPPMIPVTYPAVDIDLSAIVTRPKIEAPSHGPKPTPWWRTPSTILAVVLFLLSVLVSVLVALLS
jgi:hypothetical protein